MTFDQEGNRCTKLANATVNPGITNNDLVNGCQYVDKQAAVYNTKLDIDRSSQIALVDCWITYPPLQLSPRESW